MLIYLNGTSSSGKTSIATEIQKLSLKPVLYFSIDTVLASLPTDDLEAIKGKHPYRAPLNWEQLYMGYFSCVTSLLSAGNIVVTDCPIFNSNLAAMYAKHIEPVQEKTVVKVTCPLEVLEKRELERRDRAIGTAKSQKPEIHKYLKHDLEIDTHKLSPKESAQIIFNFVTNKK